MKTNQKLYQELRKKYTAEELADSVFVPSEQSDEEREKSRKEFARLRMEKLASSSDDEKMLAALLHLKYTIKSYIVHSNYAEEKSIGKMLKKYLKAVGRTQRKFAEEVNIHPSQLNRVIKGKEPISKSLAYRLELHSGETIPAIYWWKLMQKDVEREIMTADKEREMERKQVKVVAYRA